MYADFIGSGRILLVNSTINLFALRGEEIIVLLDVASTVDVRDLSRDC